MEAVRTRLGVLSNPAAPPQLDTPEVLQHARSQRAGHELVGRPHHQRRVEFVGHQHRTRVGDVHDAVGQVDSRTEVVAVVQQDRSERETDPHVGEQVVVGVRIGKRQRDARRLVHAVDDEHDLVSDHLDDSPGRTCDDVVRDLLEPANDRGELLVGQVLTEQREADHVGEPDREDRALSRNEPMTAQHHGTLDRRGHLAAPDVLEQLGHGRDRAVSHAGHRLGNEDRVTLHRHRASRDEFCVGDTRHGGSDDARHLERRVDVCAAERLHPL